MTDITITESHKSKAKQLLFLRLKLDPYSFYNLAELDEGASTLTLCRGQFLDSWVWDLWPRLHDQSEICDDFFDAEILISHLEYKLSPFSLPSWSEENRRCGLQRVPRAWQTYCFFSIETFTNSACYVSHSNESVRCLTNICKRRGKY